MKVRATLWASVSGTKFLQTLPELVTQLKGRYLAYLRAVVHRRCQRPPKGLGTDKKYCGSNITSKHAREHEARLPRVKKRRRKKQAFNSGAGIAQWLEHRTRDWKVAGSNPCWNGRWIFFSRVDFLCWLLFRYPFHPRVTTAARKKSRPFCQKCRWQVIAKHAYPYVCVLNRASALVTTCP